ncbi:MAG TPA: polyamine aminopropyltransferase [Methanothermococcus okinawensis]|uniref:Polyamine aminopropyltransferase n=1 Tax=Methanothermococcus okinawensis TaxID=155863 RepID=A0A832ZJ65_9EURY|nr:polyamine aminopropyltransferase [Methanococcaceae archaeon]HIP85008.1 polyamine aminopropyltransferase [Methanothermococcus okinawensis]HIP91094.1 polyamine aminopropyltransferase [Methanothermococcus okinawensis]
MPCELWFSEYQTKDLKLSVKVKDVLFTGKSKYQEIQILDTVTFGRALVLNNTFQTTEKDEFIYHELITHPAMFTHPNPRKILVIGGGDGGTIREVLKHDTVERIDFVELDEMVVEVCKKYLPTLSCQIDNEKVNTIFTDGIEYVARCKEKYDVIIVDCPDPEGPAKGLFEREFYKNLYRCLGEEGIMVQQTESPLFNRDLILKIREYLEEAGFSIVRPMVYAIPTYPSGFWSFTLASKRYDPLDVPTERIREKLKNMETKYYDEDVHRGVFLAVPKFLKENIPVF